MIRPNSIFLTTALLCATLLHTARSSTLHAFSQNGHRIVAEIAERHIQDQTIDELGKILEEQSLAQISNWADFVRSDSAYSCAAPFHFISINDSLSYATAPKSPRGDIVAALYFFEDYLRERKSHSIKQQRQALAFLVHLVGDLHQPLHVGRTDDRGGNSVSVFWFDRKTNLHSVFDNELIASQDLSFQEHVDFILQRNYLAATYQNGDYISWAQEALPLRDKLYRCYDEDKCSCAQNGKRHDLSQCASGSPSLKYQFIFQNIELIEWQMFKAGVRLARVLDKIFAPDEQENEQDGKRKPKEKRPENYEAVKKCFMTASLK